MLESLAVVPQNFALPDSMLRLLISTGLLMVAIVILLTQDPEMRTWLSAEWLANLGLLALQVSAVLTLWSMIVYLRAAWPVLRPKS
jgi:CDP-diacylglycerol--glycerol-3-phosphate 3-phosphatidyltransferase